MKKDGGKKDAEAARGETEERLRAFHVLAEAAIELSAGLREAAEAFHGDGELSDPKRGVLMQIHRHGPATVPRIARKLSFTRQHILNVVHALEEDGYVELGENPYHKRSSLVGLTTAGDDLVREMNRRENEALSRIKLDLDAAEMLGAAEVLRAVTKALEGGEWRDAASGPKRTRR